MKNEMNNPRLVVFDLIGTLADCGKRYSYAFGTVCQDYGAPLDNPGAVLSRLGDKNLRQIIEEFIPSLDPIEYPAFMAACNARCDLLLESEGWHEDLHEGAFAAISTLSAAGVLLGVYTGTREASMRALIGYHGLDEMFDPRFIRGKDNARDGFIDSARLKALQMESILTRFREEEGGPPSSILIVGDSEADRDAAESLSLSFAGFAPTAKKQAFFKESGLPFFTAFKDLPALLNLHPAGGSDGTPAFGPSWLTHQPRSRYGEKGSS